MGKARKPKKAEQIYQYYLENPHVSLRHIGRKFNTSHAQVRRILERKGVYPRYRLQQSYSDEVERDTVVFTKNLKINVKKFNKKCLVLADLHIPYHDQEALAAALAYGKELKPDYVVYLGDVLDFYQVSFWNKNPKNFDLDYELQCGRDFFTEMRDTFGDAEHYFIEGNHEKRLKNYLFSRAPQLSNLRALQLCGPDMLNLLELNIEYIDLHEWVHTYGEPFKIGKLYFLHGHELHGRGSVIYVARRALLRTLDHVIIGHSHVVQEFAEVGIASRKVIGAWSVGCLCDLYPEFNPLNRWTHGFAEVHFSDNGNFHVINHIIYKEKDSINIF